jgi:hypothetical protein
MHIVSNVEGQLDVKYDALDALAAGFPAGTVSGAPKVRAMQIIDELEKDKRGLYAGSVGYFSAAGELDSCIVLRTALIKDGVMYVQAGAGIVADSNPKSEQQECVDKAKALFRAAEEAKRFASAARRGQSRGADTAETPGRGPSVSGALRIRHGRVAGRKCPHARRCPASIRSRHGVCIRIDVAARIGLCRLRESAGSAWLCAAGRRVGSLAALIPSKPATKTLSGHENHDCFDRQLRQLYLQPVPLSRRAGGGRGRPPQRQDHHRPGDRHGS